MTEFELQYPRLNRVNSLHGWELLGQQYSAILSIEKTFPAQESKNLMVPIIGLNKINCDCKWQIFWKDYFAALCCYLLDLSASSLHKVTCIRLVLRPIQLLIQYERYGKKLPAHYEFIGVGTISAFMLWTQLWFAFVVAGSNLCWASFCQLALNSGSLKVSCHLVPARIYFCYTSY